MIAAKTAKMAKVLNVLKVLNFPGNRGGAIFAAGLLLLQGRRRWKEPLPSLSCETRGYAAGVASAVSGVAPAVVASMPASSARSASPTFSAVIRAGSINVVCSAGSVPSRR